MFLKLGERIISFFITAPAPPHRAATAHLCGRRSDAQFARGAANARARRCDRTECDAGVPAAAISVILAIAISAACTVAIIAVSVSIAGFGWCHVGAKSGARRGLPSAAIRRHERRAHTPVGCPVSAVSVRRDRCCVVHVELAAFWSRFWCGTADAAATDAPSCDQLLPGHFVGALVSVV